MASLTKAEQAKVHYAKAIAVDDRGGNPIPHYSRGIELNPEQWAYQNRGWAYFKKKDFANAVLDWNEAGDGYAKPRGRAKLATGDIDGAIADLELALKGKKGEDAAEIRGYLAKAHAAKGGKPAAAAKKNGAKRKAPEAAPFEAPKRKKNEPYDDYVARALASAGTTLDGATRKAIESLRRTAIFVTTTKSKPTEIGASRLGGLPDLPPGTKWPRASGKPMSFIGQFRLDELAKLSKTVLPKKGLLSFFVSEHEDSYLEKAAVLHVDTKGLESTPLPDDFTRRVHGEDTKAVYGPRGLTFSTAQKLPSPSNAIFKKNVKWKDGEEEAYESVYGESLVFSRHQLLGFRDMSYDAEQKATTALLLQCFSEGDMSWGDEDHLYFYVPESALAAGDFSKAFGYCGE